MCSLENINHNRIGKFPWIHHKDKPIVLHWAHLDYLLTPHSLQHSRGQKVLCMVLGHLLKSFYPEIPFLNKISRINTEGLLLRPEKIKLEKF